MTETASLEAPPNSPETCPYCDALVPAGVFCGHCGAHLADEGGRSRLHHYAASPTEHVFRMAIVTTLFPRLPRRHAHLFRETLAVGVLLVILLAALRLYTPALIAAASLLPVLYFIYLYEVEVRKAGLISNLVATFGIGGAL